MPIGFRKETSSHGTSNVTNNTPPDTPGDAKSVNGDERNLPSFSRRSISPFVTLNRSTPIVNSTSNAATNITPDIPATAKQTEFLTSATKSSEESTTVPEQFQLRRTGSFLRSGVLARSHLASNVNTSASSIAANTSEERRYSNDNHEQESSNHSLSETSLQMQSSICTSTPFLRRSSSRLISCSESGQLLDDALTKILRPQTKNTVADAQESAAWAEKKWVWIEDNSEGYIAASTVELLNGGEKTRVLVASTSKQIIIDSSSLQRMNPPKFDKVEDMAELTYLNELSVLHNLRERFYSNLIYTYSGLFLIAVNPYRDLPIYTDEIVRLYARKKRKEAPPHVYAIADAAYRMMLENSENQSILITGESGAGKTENTKKVIQYLAAIAADNSHTKEMSTSQNNVDEKLLAANPILESFGNAQTVRNNNSSRFGKFIKIEFNQFGQITSANIERYLLEKSRVTHQSSKERNFHIFYQFLRGASSSLKESLFISGDLDDYAFVRNSNKKIDGVDDKAEFAKLLEAMNTIQFGKEEQEYLFKIIASILLFGNIEFVEDKDGNCVISNPDVVEKVCRLLGVPVKEFTRALLTPTIKAGKDWVTQERTCAQVIYSVEALCRTLYDRMFGLLVEKINRSLDKPASRSHFIGVLDIAGFEIFDNNSFEQLCINYTNEKLQQFFNHHMFIQEQEEYKKEGLEWKHIDFGLDLQPVIDLIEKNNPIGILPCLDEECVMPKATDKTFGEKLNAIWKTKGTIYEAKRFNEGFSLKHYAGKVDYSLRGWLDKNKDPLNENITRLFAKSSNSYVSQLFWDYDGNEEDVDFMNRCKKGAFRTVAQKHREQLNSLMVQLNSTHPHFIRCILPNDSKRSGNFDPKMVLYQLKCNGVLEGIRVTRQGYPNRLYFLDFVKRYQIVVPAGIVRLGYADSRNSVQQILEAVGVDQAKYKIGNSKVFFKAGVLAELEDLREHHLAILISTIQTRFRCYICRSFFLSTINNLHSIVAIQRSCRNYLSLKEWSWWKLFVKLRPLLKASKIENQIDSLVKQVDELKKNLRQEQLSSQQLTQTVLEKDKENKGIETQLLKERSNLLEQSEILQLTRERFSRLEESYKETVADKQQIEKVLQEISSDSKLQLNRITLLETHLADARLNIDKLQRENAMKQQELQEVSQSLSHESSRQQQLLEQKKSYELSLAKNEQDLLEKSQRYIVLEGRCSELQDKLANLEVKHSQLVTELAEAKEEIVQKKTDNENLAKELNQFIREKDAHVLELNSELTSHVSTIEQLKKELQSKLLLKDNEINELRTEIQEEKTKHQTDMINFQQVFENKGDQQAKQMESLIGKKEDEISTLKSKLDSLNQLKIELTTEYQNSQQRNEVLSTELANLQEIKIANESTINEIRTKFEESVNFSNNLQKEKVVLESNLLEKSSELISAQSNYSKLQDDYSSQKQKLESLQMEFLRLQKENDSLNKSVVSLKQEIDEVCAVKENLEQSKRKLTNDFYELSRKLDESEVLRNEFERKFDEKVQDLDRTKSKFTSEIESITVAKNEVQNRCTQLEMSNDELKATLEKSQKSKISIQTELEDLKVEFENLSQESRNHEKNYRTYESQFRTSRVDYEQLNSQYRNLEELYKNLHINAQKDRDENLKLANLLKIKENEVFEISEELAREKQDSKRRTIASNAVSPIVQLDESEFCSKRMFDESVERFESKMALLLQENNQLLAMNERLKNQISSLESDDSVNSALKSQIRKTEQEIAILNSVIVEQNENFQSREHLLLRQLSEHEQKYESLRQENIELHERISFHLTQLAKIEENLDNKTFELEKLNKSKKGLLSEIEELKLTISSESNSKSDDIQAKRKLMNELLQAKESNEMLRSSNEDLQTEINRLAHKVQSLTVKVEVTENNLAQFEKQNYDLLTQNNSQKDEIELLLSRSDSYWAKIKKFEDSYASLQDKYHTLEIELHESCNDRKKLTNELFLLQTRYETDEADRNAHIKRLELRISNELVKLQNELENERIHCNQQKEIKKDDDAKYQELLSRMENEVSSFVASKKEKERLESKVEELQQSLNEMKATLNEKTSTLQSLSTNKKEFQSIIETLQKDLESLKIQKSFIQETNSELSSENSSLKQQLLQAQSKLDELQNQIRYIQSFVEEGNEESSRLIERLKRSEDANAALMQDINKQKSLVLEIQREKNSLDNQLKSQSIKEIEFETMAIMAKDTKRLECEISKLCENRDEILKEKQEIYKELKRSERIIVEKESQLEELTAESSKLRDLLAKLDERHRNTRESIGIMEAKEAEYSLNKKRSERTIEQLQDKIRTLEIDLSKVKRRSSILSVSGGTASMSVTMNNSRSNTPVSFRNGQTPSIASSTRTSAVESEEQI